MITDRDLAKAQLDYLALYSCVSDDEYNTYIDNINNDIPFQIFYFINGKLKSLDYLMETTN